MDLVSTFQERLTEAFREKRITQKELGELTGISRPLINMYLKGKSETTNVNCIKLAKVLNVSPVWLMGFDVAKDSNTLESNTLKDEINYRLMELNVDQLRALLTIIETFKK